MLPANGTLTPITAMWTNDRIDCRAASGSTQPASTRAGAGGSLAITGHSVLGRSVMATMRPSRSTPRLRAAPRGAGAA